MYQKIGLVLCGLFIASTSSAQLANGCLVYRSQNTGAIAAYAFDTTDGSNLLESVRIEKNGVITILRGKGTRGSVMKQCRTTMERVLGRADSERLGRILARDELIIDHDK